MSQPYGIHTLKQQGMPNLLSSIKPRYKRALYFFAISAGYLGQSHNLLSGHSGVNSFFAAGTKKLASLLLLLASD